MLEIDQAITTAQRYHTQLVIITADQSSILLEQLSTSANYPLVNVGLELSTRLIEVPKQDRARLAATLFADIINEHGEAIVLLDRIEILFDRSLALDPLKLIQSNAKNTTLVVAWPGKKTASTLTYAKPAHPEYRAYNESQLKEIVFVDANKNKRGNA